MENRNLSPVIVGETGHRNIVKEDRLRLKALVAESLRKVLRLAGERSAVMFNAFAQGADMVCVEAAFELGMDVYAILPCAPEKFAESFDDDTERSKLFPCLAAAKGIFLVPDTERRKAWMRERGVDEKSYEYRQLGIWMAAHSHLLLALWDGKPPRSEYGCGTAEVIGFALEGSYFGGETQGKGAVLWIDARREGDPPSAMQARWISANADGRSVSAELPSPERIFARELDLPFRI